jgi:dihydroorotate dehydrogenase
VVKGYFIVEVILLDFQLWGEKISNPVGLAAGFDKDGEAIDGV